MQNNLMFVPGQQLKRLDVYRKIASMNAKRRVTYEGLMLVGDIKASIAAANQREVERFKQMGHPVTHTLVAQMRAVIHAEDVIVVHGENPTSAERYYVQGVDDPAGLGFYTVIHCEYKVGV